MRGTVYHSITHVTARVERLERLLAALTERYGSDHDLVRRVADQLAKAQREERDR